MAARPAPGLVTGTSTEYLGRRPLRRILRERPLVFVLGPRGSGKTSVALRIAGPNAVYLDTAALHDEVTRAVRQGEWPERLIEAPALVLDGALFLKSRVTVTAFLRRLLALRLKSGRRTVVCEVSRDGSTELLMDRQPPGSTVTVGLRFPASRSGRLRFARRVCDEVGLPRNAATGTDAIEPWSYEGVIAELRRRREATA